MEIEVSLINMNKLSKYPFHILNFLLNKCSIFQAMQITSSQSVTAAGSSVGVVRSKVNLTERQLTTIC